MTNKGYIVVYLDDRAGDWDRICRNDLEAILMREISSVHPFSRARRGEIASIARSMRESPSRVRSWIDALDMWDEIKKRR